MNRLVVGGAAHVVRREVGSTAWAVLEELMALDRSSVAAPDAVTASVRQVGAALGISKNAAHRAIRRPVDAGLVTGCRQRDACGRFVAGEYRLSVPAEVLRRVEAEDVSPPPASVRAERRSVAARRAPAASVAQLSLLAP